MHQGNLTHDHACNPVIEVSETMLSFLSKNLLYGMINNVGYLANNGTCSSYMISVIHTLSYSCVKSS